MPVMTPEGSLRRLLSQFRDLAARLVGEESAWDRMPVPVPARVFGDGSRQPFADYFEGESSVRVASIDDIVAWLQTCEYVTDLEQFQQRDVWQHPGIFEQQKRGDCEDFALWAWRKLGELGIDAEFYVGRVMCEDPSATDRQHAWVVYALDGTEFLFEPAARTPSQMIRPLADAMAGYVPHFAVNHRFDTHAFVGCTIESPHGSLNRSNPATAI
jgi:hypothetical protein